MNRILILIILSILVVSGGYYFLNNQLKSRPQSLPQGAVCDSETMVCEDGTVLKKEGPNCDFPPCPSENASGSASINGEAITVTGILICLPHKNTSGPQTLECAYGIKGSDGNNYGLEDPSWKYLMGVGTSEEIKIIGKLKPAKDSKYDIQGIIQIDSLEKL